MHFTLTIDHMDNAAFEEPDQNSEVARILRKVARQLEEDQDWNPDGHVLRDINGNFAGAIHSNCKDVDGTDEP